MPGNLRESVARATPEDETGRPPRESEAPMAATNMENELMLTPAELAAHLRCSERTVSRMVTDGCPSMLVGARRRFELEAVMTWTRERACLPEKTQKAAGTQRLASTAAAYTDASRKVHLRVMPGASKQS